MDGISNVGIVAAFIVLGAVIFLGGVSLAFQGNIQF